MNTLSYFGKEFMSSSDDAEKARAIEAQLCYESLEWDLIKQANRLEPARDFGDFYDLME
jgi:hypothetical protein